MLYFHYNSSLNFSKFGISIASIFMGDNKIMEEKEQKEILAGLKASKDNNVMLRGKDGKKYSLSILDLIKYKDKRMYAVVKPPIDFPNAHANKVMVFGIRYNSENLPCLCAVADRETKIAVFGEYN